MCNFLVCLFNVVDDLSAVAGPPETLLYPGWLQCSNFCFLDYFVSVCACVDAHVVRGADAAVDGCLTPDKTPLEQHKDLGTREIALGSSHGGYHFIVKDPAGLS